MDMRLKIAFNVAATFLGTNLCELLSPFHASLAARIDHFKQTGKLPNWQSQEFKNLQRFFIQHLLFGVGVYAVGKVTRFNTTAISISLIANTLFAAPHQFYADTPLSVPLILISRIIPILAT